MAVDTASGADFLAALVRLPPDDLQAFQRLARLTLVRRPEDFALFDAVFAAHFLGAAAPPRRNTAEDEEITEENQGLGSSAPALVAEGGGGGRSASLEDGHGRRSFGGAETLENAELSRFAATLVAAMPTVPRRARRPAPRGDRLDLRRILKNARRTGGEPVRLAYTARPRRRRRLLLLVDVSGSLKEHTPRMLRVARAAVRSGVPAEAFTFATRLTRVTRALKRRDGEAALTTLSALVSDADGGTRIGASLTALLADPRHQALIRGAVVMVVSDGLERGDPEEMRRGTERLARLGHRLLWLSPLAESPDYRPRTRAMQAAAASIDLLDTSTTVAAFTRAAAALPALARRPRGRALRTSTLEQHP